MPETAAQPAPGLRLAVVGKGGVGKTVVAATLARALARRERSVLAADLDTNPGLAFSLGVPPDAGAVPDELTQEDEAAPYGWGLREGLTPARAVADHAVTGPDGVRFLSLGKSSSESRNEAPKRTLTAFRAILTGFAEPGWDVVGDLEAGPTTPFERYHSFADRLLLVVTPTWTSAMTARRLLSLVDGVAVTVVANRVTDRLPHEELGPAVGIPFDPDVVEAERAGLAPLDACPDSPMVGAVEALADRLVNQEVAV